MESSSILEIIDVSTVDDMDEKGMMNLYYRIYNATMESNMSITKKVNLFKKLSLDLYTIHSDVIYTNLDYEISKIAKVLKRSIRRKHYR